MPAENPYSPNILKNSPRVVLSAMFPLATIVPVAPSLITQVLLPIEPISAKVLSPVALSVTVK